MSRNSCDECGGLADAHTADCPNRVDDRAVVVAEALEVVGSIGAPFPMYGFQGCTDRNPDVCACATDTDVECAACGEVIEPDTLTYARQEGQPWMAPDDPEQEWITLWWHASCDTRPTTPGAPA